MNRGGGDVKGVMEKGESIVDGECMPDQEGKDEQGNMVQA